MIKVSLSFTNSLLLNGRIIKDLLVFATCILLTFNATAQQYVTAKIPIDSGGLALLAQLGIALDHVHLDKDFVQGDFSRFEMEEVRKAGFNVEVIAPDAELAYQLRKSSDQKYARNDAACLLELEHFDIKTPKNFSLGSYQGNFTYQEMLDHLDQMVLQYPHLISERSQIGSHLTYEGRPLQWIRISDNPNEDEKEPEMLYTAVHHAREPVSMTQLIYYMWYLLENYEKDGSIKYLVDHTALYFLPCVNPDGYIYNETIRPSGGGLWRKNRRKNADGSFGVDLNRNYGHKWGVDNQGSSSNTNSEVYRGTAPFSEVETQAVRDFTMEHDFKIALNYHSYGGFLIYPYGYTDQPVEDIQVFQELAMLLTRDNNYVYGTGFETVSYFTNGDADDWMYGETNEKPQIFAMTPEVGTEEHGFWPHQDDVEFLCKSTLRQNIDAAQFLLNGGDLVDESESFVTELEGSLPFRLTKLGFEDVGFSLKLEALTQNIQFNQPAKLYILGLFSTERDNVAYTLSSDIKDGEKISFVYHLDNGFFTRRDTIIKYFREDRFLLHSDGDLSQWKQGGLQDQWGISNKVFYSPPSSLTDSPNGNYIPYSTNYLTISEPLVLQGVDSVVLTFKALWDIQYRFDYLALEVSTDGVVFTPLCGVQSTLARPQSVKGTPVYTGRQTDWVSERIDLTDFIGQVVTLRFSMVSTHNDTRDGFYLDDVKILEYNEGAVTSSKEIVPSSFEINLAPNPARDQVQIVTLVEKTNAAFTHIKFFNQVGQLVKDLPFQRSLTIDVSAWSTGMYFYQYQDAEGKTSRAKKLIVSR